MKIPVWLKPGIWGAVIGAVALALVGFTQLGWMSAASGERLANSRSELAVLDALVPFCLAKAERDPDATIMAKFKTEQSSYSRNDLVTKAGWATLNGGKVPNDGLARACSTRLHETQTG